MIDKYINKITGEVRITARDKFGRIRLLHQAKNLILPLAHSIVAHRMANLADSLIDGIKIYHLGGLVYYGVVIQTDLVSPTEVEYTASFSDVSFSGDFDEARLNASQMGDFSRLTGFLATKNPLEALTITWKIKTA